MSANVQGMVREGINAVKAGKKDEARALLLKAVELDPYNEDGWLWLSGLVDTPEDQRTCLENVLAINPANERARLGLDYLNGKRPTVPTAKPEIPSKPKPSVTNSSNAAPPAPPKPASAPIEVATNSSFIIDESALPGLGTSGFETATSVEWHQPASSEPSLSAGSWKPAFEPSKQDLDDWVSTLGLAGDEDEKDEGANNGATFTAAPFTDIDFGDDSPETDDDFLSSGPFTNPAFNVPLEEFASAAPAAASAFDPFAASASPTVETPAPKKSPVPKKSPDKPAEPNKPSIKETSFPDADRPGRAALMEDLDPDEDEIVLEEGEGEVFDLIPDTIKPTRLPGTHQDAPLLLVLVMTLLILTTIGVFALVAIRLLGYA